MLFQTKSAKSLTGVYSEPVTAAAKPSFTMFSYSSSG